MARLKSILAGLALSLFGAAVVAAPLAHAVDIVTSSGVWYKSGSAMLLNPSTLEVGSSTGRVAKGYFQDLDVAGVFTFGGTLVSSLDMDGYDIILDQDGNSAIVNDRDATILDNEMGIKLNGSLIAAFTTSGLKANSIQTYSGGSQAMTVATTGSGNITIGNSTSGSMACSGTVCTFANGGVQMNAGATIGTASANYWNFAGGSSGQPATVAAVGETNAPLRIGAAGSGTLSLNTTGTGGVTIGNGTSGTLSVSGSSMSFSGVTQLNGTATIAAASTNNLVVSGGSTGNPPIVASSGETNAPLKMTAAGSGALSLNTTNTGTVTVGNATGGSTLNGSVVLASTLNATSSATNAITLGTTQKLCFGAAGSQCLLYGGSNVIQTDSSVGFASLGTLQAQGNFDVRGGMLNAGTGANCTGNTGAVCVNDAAGFAVADGSGTTVSTITAAGKHTVATLAITATTDLGSINLSLGTGTATVRSGAKCFCTDTTAALGVQCTVSSTTLTATGTASDIINYLCLTAS